MRGTGWLRAGATDRLRQRLVAVGLLASLGGAAGMLTTVPALAVAEDAGEFRTETPQLGGFAAEGQAAPLSVQFYETISQLPTDPGESEAEATSAFTQAEISSGPSTRAVASSFWPGAALGDGFPTVCSCEEKYFIKSEATFPAGPTEETSQAPFMQTFAHGLDTYAIANEKQSPNEDAAGFGSANSRVDSTVVDGVAIARSVSAVSNVDIAGVIKIKSVRTILEATSDGTNGATSGQTAVSGLSILDQPFVIDENGLRPEGGEGVPFPIPGIENSEGMGIHIELVGHDELVEGNVAERRAGGLRITIDFPSFFEGMPGEVSGPVTDVVTGVVGAIPIDEVRNNALSVIFASLTTGPKVTYTLARASVYSAANTPFVFELPALPSFPPPAAPAAFTPPPSLSFDPPTFSAPQGSEPSVLVEQPQVAGPFVPQPVAATQELPEWWRGWYPALIALGAGLTLFGAYGLDKLTGAVFAGAGGAACSRGAVKRLPTLRP